MSTDKSEIITALLNKAKKTADMQKRVVAIEENLLTKMEQELEKDEPDFARLDELQAKFEEIDLIDDQLREEINKLESIINRK